MFLEDNMDINNDFWTAIDKLINSSKIVIHQPQRTVHLKFTDFIDKVDYGYLDDTSSMDNGG